MIQGPMGFEEIGEEEDFAAMLEESFKNEKSDRVVEGVIVDIKDDYASVDVGKKIEGRLPVSEIKNKDGSFKFAVGDKILVAISGAKNERPIISHKNAVKKEVQTAFAKSVMVEFSLYIKYVMICFFITAPFDPFCISSNNRSFMRMWF